ncbi:MAG: DUF3011 domain-containing protein [Gammaproteobacteria bacterium]
MRAIKIITATALCLTMLPVFAGTLTCASSDNSFKHCTLSNANERDIRIQKVTAGDCDANNAWGVNGSGIWVDKGCSAVFEYTPVSPSSSAYSDDSGYGPDVVIAPGFVAPYYGPGFYYGAGYYEYNNWNGNGYCNGHQCNRNQLHNNAQANQDINNAEEHHQENEEDHPHNEYHPEDDAFHGGSHEEGNFHGGGFHGGGRR